MFKKLDFSPLPWLKSPHAQMVIANFFWKGFEVPSSPLWVNLSDNDMLCCAVSTPPEWTQKDRTVVLVHGLGGDQSSHYMIRISRRLYYKGIRVVRVNLRGCGPGKNMSKLPYNGGTSPDLLAVLNRLKTLSPKSSISLAGFSLGGNVTLKMLGELGASAAHLVDHAIAVCPPVDLGDTVERICARENQVYHKYYLNCLVQQTKRWTAGKKIRSVYEFDEVVTAPQWNYASAADYYDKSSSRNFISDIAVPTDILFTEDDPFISYEPLKNVSIPVCVNIWVAKHGGHMGFIGFPGGGGFFWLDHLIVNWVTKKTLD